MNGQNPTNNGIDNQNGLNGNVLGTVAGENQNPTTNQVPPQINTIPNQEQNIENIDNNMSSFEISNPLPNTENNLESTQPTNSTPEINVGVVGNLNNEPVAVPIPGTEEIPQNLASNSFGKKKTIGSNRSIIEPKKNENIGIVPPPNENPNGTKPKPMNKILFIILILVLIALVAFGVYYFLNISSSKVKLTPKNITVGVGESLSDKISDYATIVRGDIKNCDLNIEQVKANTIGEYPYTITCGKDVYNGKVFVSDITAPKVTLNIVFKPINNTVVIEDFVASCVDPSNCTAEFVDENAVNNYLSTPGGPYTIPIKVSDTAGNEETVNGLLYVTPYNIVAFTKCSSPSENMNEYQATKIVSDMLPIGNDETGTMVYLGVARRIYTYTFANADEYNKVIGNKSDTITFDGITGVATYDDENKTLEISTDLSTATLNNENNGAFPTKYSEFLPLYTVGKGYSYSNIAYNKK